MLFVVGKHSTIDYLTLLQVCRASLAVPALVKDVQPEETYKVQLSSTLFIRSIYFIALFSIENHIQIQLTI